MGQIHLRHQFPYPAPEVWGWLSDYTNIHRIHPLIEKSYAEGSKSCGVGAVRVCEMKGGMRLKERVVDWREGGQYTVDVFETTMPMMARSTVTLGVRPVNVGASEVFIDAEYAMKYGLIGGVADVLFMNRMMRAVLGAMFNNLERSLRGAPSRAA